MDNPENSLIIASRRDLPTFEFNTWAKEAKAKALEVAALIGKVSNADSKVLAVRAQVELKRQINEIEKARKKLKEPLLEAGRQLDNLCAKESLQLDQEFGRVSNLVKEFDDAERRRVLEEERLQREELERIERAKQAEIKRLADEQAAREAEARRQQEEAERKVREAKEKAKKEAEEQAEREAEARRQQEESERKVREARETAEREAKEAREAAEKLASEAKNKKEREAAEKAKKEAEEQAALKQAEVAKQEEAARIEQEAREASLREQAATVANNAAEVARQEEAAKAEQAQREAALQAQAAEVAAKTAQVEERAGDDAYCAARPIGITKVAGQRSTTNWVIVVEQPFVLAKYHPNLVDIKPRIADIKDALNQGFEVKGIKATKETTAGVRVGTAPKAIDV